MAYDETMAERILAALADEPDAYQELLARPGAGKMEFTGRPMRGMIIVEAGAVSEDRDLDRWLGYCREFVGDLEPK